MKVETKIPKNNISEESLKQTTGKTLPEWITILDKEGAENLSHKEIAKLLYDKKYIESGWWCQMVTVQYEYAKGKRVVGQTKNAGYEIGVQKTLHISQERLWDLLTSPKGYTIWLGNVEEIEFTPHFIYETSEGITGEIRTVTKGEKLRLTWKPKNWKNSSTIQIYLLCHRNTPAKTSLHFHQEKLSSVKTREEMRTHWKNVIKKIEELM